MKKVREPLAKHTTFRIGGMAEIVIPESKKELLDIVAHCKETNRSYKILGNGSNILVSDNDLDDLIIKTTEICNDLIIENNTVNVGASVKLQRLINELINNDLGGIEYLYSVPGTVGGAIYMNAGRGKKYDLSMSDHLVNIEICNGKEIIEIPKENLKFDYRYSSLHEKDEWVIISGTFKFLSQSKNIGKKKIENRMNLVRKNERSYPNAGSIFKEGPYFPLKGLRIGDAKFVQNNRICNLENANFSQVYLLIKLAQFIHQVIPFVKNTELEIEIWK